MTDAEVQAAIMFQASAYVAGMLDKTNHPAIEPTKMRADLIALIEAYGAWREGEGKLAGTIFARRKLAEWRLRPIESAMPSLAHLEGEAIEERDRRADALKEIIG